MQASAPRSDTGGGTTYPGAVSTLGSVAAVAGTIRMFELPPSESDENGREDLDLPASGYGSEQRRARRRERYLDAVIQAIRTTGADATMAELAAGAGVSKPVLYDLFGDRLGLTTAVVTKLGDISASEHRPNREDELPNLAELFDSFLQFVEDDPEIYRWVLRCSADQSELLRQLISATIQGRQLHRLVEASDDGAPETADVTSTAIAGFAVAAVDSWLARRDISRSDLVAYLSRFVANGLGSQQHLSSRPGSVSPAASRMNSVTTVTGEMAGSGVELSHSDEVSARESSEYRKEK